MTRRLLPMDEWSRLAETPELGPVWRQLPPATLVVVVEDAGRIVATWAVLPVVHVEGAWIDAAYPRASVPLLRGMRDAARALGASGSVWTGAENATTEAILTRLHAQRVPFQSFIMPLTKGES